MPIHIPPKTKLPRLDQLTVEWRGRRFSLPYLYREGKGGPCVFFVHGLGGAKENFYAALQSPALADCTLLTFDEPGTGLAAFDPDANLNMFSRRVVSHTLDSFEPMFRKMMDELRVSRYAGDR